MNRRGLGALILLGALLAPAVLVIAGSAPGALAATSPTTYTTPLSVTWQAPSTGAGLVPQAYQMRFLPNGSVYLGDLVENVTFSFGSSAATNPTSFTYNGTEASYSYVLSHSCDVTVTYTAPTTVAGGVEQSLTSSSCAHTGTYPFSFFSKLGTLPIAYDSTGGTTGTVCDVQFGELHYSWCGDSMTGATLAYTLAGSSYTIELVTTAATWSVDPSLVQDNNCANNNIVTSAEQFGTCAYTSDVSSGDLLVGCLYVGDNQGFPASDFSVADTQGNAWHVAASQTEASGPFTEMYYAKAGSTAADTVDFSSTTSLGSNSINWVATVFDVSGVSNDVPIATATGSGASGTSISTSSLSFSAYDWLLGCVGAAGDASTTGLATGFSYVEGGGSNQRELAMYSVTSNGVTSPTDFPDTQSSSSFPWVDVGAYFQTQPTVTVAVALSIQGGAATDSASVSCTGGGGTYTTSGGTQDFTCNASVAVTLTLSSGGANNRWCFSGACTGSESWTSCASGTCSTQSYNYYEQFQNAYQVDANAQTDFPTGMSWAVSGYQSGSSGQILCTISSTAATSDSCSGWGDYDQTTTIPQAASSPPANSRWYSSAACTSTPTTGGNTYTCQSYGQWSTTWEVTANARSTFDSSSMTSTVSGNQYGSSTTICTITTASGSSTATCSGYIDNGQAATYSTALSSPPANERWECSSCLSSAIVSGGTEPNVNYYDQLYETFAVDANAQTDFDTGMSWGVTGTSLGSAGTLCTISSTAATSDSCTAYADYNTATTIPQAASSPPANSRWYSSAACTSTPTTGGNAYTCQSYKQWTNDFLYSDSGGGSIAAPTLTCDQFGSTATLALTTSSQSFYCDNGSSTSSTNPTQGSTSSERWDDNGQAFTVSSGAGTETFAYYHQYSVSSSYSMAAGSLGSCSAPQVTYDQFGSAVHTTLTTTPAALWMDAASGWSTPDPLSGSTTTQRCVAPSGTSGTPSSGGTVAPAYYEQFALSNPQGLGVTRTDNGTSAATDSTATWFDASTQVTVAGKATVAYSVQSTPLYVYQPCSDGTQLMLNVSATAPACGNGKITLTSNSAEMQFFLPTGGTLSKFLYNLAPVTSSSSQVTGGTVYTAVGEPGTAQVFEVDYSVSSQSQPSGGNSGSSEGFVGTTTTTTGAVPPIVVPQTTTTPAQVNFLGLGLFAIVALLTGVFAVGRFERKGGLNDIAKASRKFRTLGGGVKTRSHKKLGRKK